MRIRTAIFLTEHVMAIRIIRRVCDSDMKYFSSLASEKCLLVIQIPRVIMISAVILRQGNVKSEADSYSTLSQIKFPFIASKFPFLRFTSSANGKPTQRARISDVRTNTFCIKEGCSFSWFRTQADRHRFCKPHIFVHFGSER